MAEEHEKIYAQFCEPHFRHLTEGISKIEERLRPVEIKISNGFDNRMKAIEKLQWWVISMLVAITGLIITLHVVV